MNTNSMLLDSLSLYGIDYFKRPQHYVSNYVGPCSPSFTGFKDAFCLSLQRILEFEGHGLWA